jgi:16S rRNA (uracil1498-N3)-methyltransferase
VTAPLYLMPAGRLDDVVPGSTVELDGGEARHAVAVRRTRVGEHLDLADGAGLRAACVVTEVEAGGRRATLVAQVVTVTPVTVRHPRLVLVQALAKGGRDELAVETATELGVDAVVPWQAERSVVVWAAERGVRARQRWQATAVAAAKQSRRAVLPVIEAASDTAALVTRVAAVVTGGGAVLVLHEQAAAVLGRTVLPADGAVAEVAVVVGPEGGITDAEVGALVAAGAVAVRLGPEVLRSSSAGPAALAVLSSRLGRWS